jgi:hypothetical protein
MWYRLQLPRVSIRPSGSPAGRMIGDHFAIREEGRYRYRSAQGFLPLPTDFSDYMRGRSRQAVRTNVRRAHEHGLSIVSDLVADWRPGPGDLRAPFITPGPVERWTAVGPKGHVAAQAILSVDEEVALLHGLVGYSAVTNARWLLHAAIVERLCGQCRLLLTNSDDAYLMAPGARYFQSVLGYEIARLSVPRPERRRPEPVQALPPTTAASLQADTAI